MHPTQLKLIAIRGMPEVGPGDDLSELLNEAMIRDALVLLENDVLVVAQKIVSKSEGRLVDLDQVKVDSFARKWSRKHAKDERVTQVVLNESSRIVRMDRGRLIVETHGGLICANAGVDSSNVPSGMVSLLPLDSDKSARLLRTRLCQSSGVAVGVVISDTFGRPWRIGQTNVALGVAGLPSLLDYRGKLDSAGRSLKATQIALADELAAAAELLMGKTLGVPAVLIRGLQLGSQEGTASDLVRSPELDLFR